MRSDFRSQWRCLVTPVLPSFSEIDGLLACLCYYETASCPLKILDYQRFIYHRSPVLHLSDYMHSGILIISFDAGTFRKAHGLSSPLNTFKQNCLETSYVFKSRSNLSLEGRHSKIVRVHVS